MVSAVDEVTSALGTLASALSMLVSALSIVASAARMLVSAARNVEIVKNEPEGVKMIFADVGNELDILVTAILCKDAGVIHHLYGIDCAILILIVIVFSVLPMAQVSVWDMLVEC